MRSRLREGDGPACTRATRNISMQGSYGPVRTLASGTSRGGHLLLHAPLLVTPQHVAAGFFFLLLQAKHVAAG